MSLNDHSLGKVNIHEYGINKASQPKCDKIGKLPMFIG